MNKVPSTIPADADGSEHYLIRVVYDAPGMQKAAKMRCKIQFMTSAGPVQAMKDAATFPRPEQPAPQMQMGGGMDMGGGMELGGGGMGGGGGMDMGMAGGGMMGGGGARRAAAAACCCCC